MEGYMNTITLIDVIVLVLAYVGLSVACMLIRWLIGLPYRRRSRIQHEKTQQINRMHCYLV